MHRAGILDAIADLLAQHSVTSPASSALNSFIASLSASQTSENDPLEVHTESLLRMLADGVGQNATAMQRNGEPSDSLWKAESSDLKNRVESLALAACCSGDSSGEARERVQGGVELSVGAPLSDSRKYTPSKHHGVGAWLWGNHKGLWGHASLLDDEEDKDEAVEHAHKRRKTGHTGPGMSTEVHGGMFNALDGRLVWRATVNDQILKEMKERELDSAGNKQPNPPSTSAPPATTATTTPISAGGVSQAASGSAPAPTSASAPSGPTLPASTASSAAPTVASQSAKAPAPTPTAPVQPPSATAASTSSTPALQDAGKTEPKPSQPQSHGPNVVRLEATHYMLLGHDENLDPAAQPLTDSAHWAKDGVSGNRAGALESDIQWKDVVPTLVSQEHGFEKVSSHGAAWRTCTDAWIAGHDVVDEELTPGGPGEQDFTKCMKSCLAVLMALADHSINAEVSLVTLYVSPPDHNTGMNCPGNCPTWPAAAPPFALGRKH